MTKNTKAPASGEILFVPLNRLKKSLKNARRTPHYARDPVAHLRKGA
jgi:hypothetical protein